MSDIPSRMMVVSPMGQDRTLARVRVKPMSAEKRQKLRLQQEDGLNMLVKYEEDKLLEKRRKQIEKEDKLKMIKEKALRERV